MIRNAPLLDDGTPMPTRYWLVDPDLSLRVARLESAGGVRAAEAAVDADELGSPRTSATPASATPRSRPTTSGPVRAAASAAPAAA